MNKKDEKKYTRNNAHNKHRSFSKNKDEEEKDSIKIRAWCGDCFQYFESNPLSKICLYHVQKANCNLVSCNKNTNIECIRKFPNKNSENRHTHCVDITQVKNWDENLKIQKILYKKRKDSGEDLASIINGLTLDVQMGLIRKNKDEIKSENLDTEEHKTNKDLYGSPSVSDIKRIKRKRKNSMITKTTNSKENQTKSDYNKIENQEIEIIKNGLQEPQKISQLNMSKFSIINNANKSINNQKLNLQNVSFKYNNWNNNIDYDNLYSYNNYDGAFKNEKKDNQITNVSVNNLNNCSFVLNNKDNSVNHLIEGIKDMYIPSKIPNVLVNIEQDCITEYNELPRLTKFNSKLTSKLDSNENSFNPFISKIYNISKSLIYSIDSNELSKEGTPILNNSNLNLIEDKENIVTSFNLTKNNSIKTIHSKKTEHHKTKKEDSSSSTHSSILKNKLIINNYKIVNDQILSNKIEKVNNFEISMNSVIPDSMSTKTLILTHFNSSLTDYKFPRMYLIKFAKALTRMGFLCVKTLRLYIKKHGSFDKLDLNHPKQKGFFIHLEDILNKFN